MTHKKNISQERLKQVLSYDPNTGIFTWIYRVSNRIKVGDIAGVIGTRGYIEIGMLRHKYYAHQLAWLYMTGQWPGEGIDHKDRSKTNNRISNLRAASQTENVHNTGMRSNNTSGVHGVSWDKRSGKWLAKICRDRKQKAIGLFDSIAEAQDAYEQARAALHPTFIQASDSSSK